jgi:hypothetical protein
MPADQTVYVQAGQTKTVSGTYEKKPADNQPVDEQDDKTEVENGSNTEKTTTDIPFESASCLTGSGVLALLVIGLAGFLLTGIKLKS